MTPNKRTSIVLGDYSWLRAEYLEMALDDLAAYYWELNLSPPEIMLDPREMAKIINKGKKITDGRTRGAKWLKKIRESRFNMIHLYETDYLVFKVIYDTK